MVYIFLETSQLSVILWCWCSTLGWPHIEFEAQLIFSHKFATMSSGPWLYIDEPRIGLILHKQKHWIFCHYFLAGVTALNQANETGLLKNNVGFCQSIISELNFECCKYLYFISISFTEKTPTSSGIKNSLHKGHSKLHPQHS